MALYGTRAAAFSTIARHQFGRNVVSTAARGAAASLLSAGALLNPAPVSAARSFTAGSSALRMSDADSEAPFKTWTFDKSCDSILLARSLDTSSPSKFQAGSQGYSSTSFKYLTEKLKNIKMVKTSALVAFLAISGASAFAPAPVPSQVTTSSLEMKKNSPFSKFVATASVASAILLSSAAPDAQAISGAGDFDFGSDNVIAARSGGRAGGRSSASSMRSPPPSSRRPTTVNNVSRTTVIQQQPAIVAAPVMASPIIVSPVVSPFGSPYGMGGGYGALGVVNAIGNEMREGRQEAEIRRERDELQESKQKQFQLEQRLNQMEQNQATTNAVNAALAGAR